MKSMAIVETTQTLYVAWQQPESRQFFPVGRLTAETDLSTNTKSVFEFRYIEGALTAANEGFQPFLEFPDFDRVYRSHKLFPFFANRVMSRNRPDFARYAAALALDPQTADEMSLLIRSGGVRATDSIELFPHPVLDPAEMCYESYFLVHGLRHCGPEAEARVLRLRPQEQLVLAPEPTNPVDPRAIKLRTSDGVQVGYVPRYLVADFSLLADICDYFEVFVARVNPPPAPTQHRLLCRLLSCWPDGFEPFSCSNFKTTVPEA